MCTANNFESQLVISKKERVSDTKQLQQQPIFNFTVPVEKPSFYSDEAFQAAAVEWIIQ